MLPSPPPKKKKKPKNPFKNWKITFLLFKYFFFNVYRPLDRIVARVLLTGVLLNYNVGLRPESFERIKSNRQLFFERNTSTLELPTHAAALQFKYLWHDILAVS